jgi:hypothetical protein
LADWKKVGVQAISSIIASGLILGGFNIFYNDLYNKPHISPQWKFATDGSAIITIKNDGRVAATHMILTLQTPENMTKNSPYVFHTVNITNSEKINSQLLQISTPSFPTGDGSTIKVIVWLTAKPPTYYPSYVFYATYDQGSIKIITEKPLTYLEEILNFSNTYWIPITLIGSGLAVFVFFVGLIIVRRSRKGAVHEDIMRIKRERSYTSASQILNDILLVYDSLKHQESLSRGLGLDDQAHLSTEHFYISYKWQQWYNIRFSKLLNNDIGDYFAIDNFFKTIKDREYVLRTFDAQRKKENVKAQPDEENLKKINQETLDACERCLFGIDWTKYK